MPTGSYREPFRDCLFLWGSHTSLITTGMYRNTPTNQIRLAAHRCCNPEDVYMTAQVLEKFLARTGDDLLFIRYNLPLLLNWPEFSVQPPLDLKRSTPVLRGQPPIVPLFLLYYCHMADGNLRCELTEWTVRLIDVSRRTPNPLI